VPKKKRKLISPTPEEEERINAGIAADPDTYELSDEEIAGMQPFRRGRPKSDSPKISVTVRLDPEIVTFFRDSGPGWQTRMNAALAEYVVKKKRA
jgi:uncharacterized protein (DUF4415 family)